MTMGACVAFGELRADSLGRGSDETSLEVVVLPVWGGPLSATVELTEKWAARGWQRALSCPTCGRVARVLRVRRNQLVCGSCAPRATPHHTLKRTDYWRRDGGSLVDQIARLVGSRGRADQRLRGLVVRLEALADERCRQALAQAHAAIETFGEQR